MKKKIIAIIFGGDSTEHAVSIRSARSVYDAINKKRYRVKLIYITKKGVWHALSNESFTMSDEEIVQTWEEVDRTIKRTKRGFFLPTLLRDVSLAFPLVHGNNGEDGSLQGFFQLLDMPYIGAGVTGSAVGIDKEVMKRLLRESEVPIATFLVFTEKERMVFDAIRQELGLPFFIKPASTGSSVGVSKVGSEADFRKAVDEAFTYDTKVLCEEFIAGQEVEVSVLGNNDPEVSVVGEIRTTYDFYSYTAKYLDDQGAELIIPARIAEVTAKKVQRMARQVFKILRCSDMARVDFFVRNETEIFVNEINTLPGFTSISMYPKLWEASGIPYEELITRLIDIAFIRYNTERRIKTSYQA